MDENKNNNKNNGVEGASLWRAVTRDVKRLPGKDYVDFAPAPQKPEDPAHVGAVIVPPKARTPRKLPQGKGLDRRTEERLRKGKMPIEARLDLHGLTQDQARTALNAFIKSAYGRGKRCVLIITGKGESPVGGEGWFAPEPGVLKRRVPDWLEQPPIGEYILKIYPARPKDGGAGALYVYLRRQREG